MVANTAVTGSGVSRPATAMTPRAPTDTASIGRRRRITATPPARARRRLVGEELVDPAAEAGAVVVRQPGARLGVEVDQRLVAGPARPQARRHGDPAGGDEHDDPQQRLQTSRPSVREAGCCVAQSSAGPAAATSYAVVTPKPVRPSTSAPPTSSRQASSSGVPKCTTPGAGELGRCARRTSSAPVSVGRRCRRVDGDEPVEVVGRGGLGQRAAQQRRRRDGGAVLEAGEVRRAARRHEVELAAEGVEQAGRAGQRLRRRRGHAVEERHDDVAHVERRQQPSAAQRVARWRSARSRRAADRRSAGRRPASGPADPSSRRRRAAIATPSPRSSVGNGIRRGSPRYRTR